MRSKGSILSFVIRIAFVLMAARSLVAGGLSTQLGEVVVENLSVGETYDLGSLANLSLIVTNTSEYSVELLMEVLEPGESELKLGAETIPDVSWVTLSPCSFLLAPNDKATSDIVLSIPDEDQYLGKKYQVMVWSHTVGGSDGGMVLAYGLKSRIIFTTQPERSTAPAPVGNSGVQANLQLLPDEIHLEHVALGALFDVQKETGSVMTVVNPDNAERTYRLHSQTVHESFATLADGYMDAPDASYLSFSESEFSVPANSSKNVRIFVQFPETPEYRDKHYMFILHVQTENSDVAAGAYSRLYVSTL